MMRLRNFLSVTVPVGAGRKIYQLSLRVLETRLRLAEIPCEVWPRHSYVLGAFAPFLSDLDLTIWVKENFHPVLNQRLTKTLTEMGSIFPWMRDNNCYYADEVHFLLEVANSFQLAKDPRLAERLNSVCPRPLAKREISAEQAAYLLRALDTDVCHFIGMQVSRDDKWRLHFERLKLPRPASFSLGEIISSISRLVDLDLSTQEILTRYYDVNVRAGQFGEDDPQARARLAPLFPQAFIGDLSSKESLSPQKISLIQAQLSWEIFGSYTQLHRLDISTAEHDRWLLERYRSLISGEDYITRALDRLQILKAKRGMIGSSK